MQSCSRNVFMPPTTARTVSICLDIVHGVVLTGVGGGAGGRGHAAGSALDGRHLGEVVGAESWMAVQGRVDGGWQKGVR